MDVFFFSESEVIILAIQNRKKIKVILSVHLDTVITSQFCLDDVKNKISCFII